MLINETTTEFTLTKKEGFLTYSEKFRKLYGTEYAVGSDGSLIALTAKKVNFKTLHETLLSKDESKLEANKWMFDGEFRFCDGEKLPSKIGFLSFPRSGNSFLRRFLEQMTGIATGASVSLHTSTTLQLQGMPGEYIVDDRTWIVKSHQPMIIPL